MKKQAMKREKTFANHISGKGVISEVCYSCNHTIAKKKKRLKMDKETD